MLCKFTVAVYCSDSAGGRLQQHACEGSSGDTVAVAAAAAKNERSSVDPLS